jgi:hypothetical protein
MNGATKDSHMLSRAHEYSIKHKKELKKQNECQS